MMKLNQLVTTLSAALVLAACGGGSSSGNSNNNAAASATPASAPATASATASGKVLRIGTNAEFAPFESLNEKQEIQGFDIDLLKAMAAEGGFQVEFKHTPWDGIFAALNNKDVDVVASAVTITDDRKKTMDFTDSYYKITQVVLVPPSKTVKSVEDVKQLSKVGVVSGQTGDFATQKIFGATSNNIARFDTITLLIKEVENGGVDAAVSDSAVIQHYIKNNTGKGFSMIQVPDFTEENYGFAVRKGDTETLNMLNSALKKIQENGKYKEIESKYFAH
nr:basic amino acid ABC transporter substrate-binding protein [Alysiella crassa]UOP06262.1 basic amino acid ABC transporter substrate-binding protein [Alysiella crassa]